MLNENIYYKWNVSFPVITGKLTEAIKNSLSKLKPGKLKSLQNSIKTQFNFKGGT